jgi:hypothetical protein
MKLFPKVNEIKVTLNGAHPSRIIKQAGSLGELVRRTYDI